MRIGSWLRIAGLVLACGASNGCDWPWRHDMYDQPSSPAAVGPRAPAPGAMAVEAFGPYDRLAEEFTPDPLPPQAAVPGSRLQAMYCSPCHGGAVEHFFPRIPPLNSAEVQRHGDGYLYVIITNGTQMMPSYGHELAPAERWQIVRFLRTLPRQ